MPGSIKSPKKFAVKQKTQEPPNLLALRSRQYLHNKTEFSDGTTHHHETVSDPKSKQIKRSHNDKASSGQDEENKMRMPKKPRKSIQTNDFPPSHAFTGSNSKMKEEMNLESLMTDQPRSRFCEQISLVPESSGSYTEGCNEEDSPSSQLIEKIPDPALESSKSDRVLKYLKKRALLVTPQQSNLQSRRVFQGFKAPRRTAVTTCYIMGQAVEVTLTNEASEVDKWLTPYVQTCRITNGDNSRLRPGAIPTENPILDFSEGGKALLGLDLEWRPNRWPGSDNKVATLQLSNRTKCLVIQMLFLDRVPEKLESVLMSSHVLLGGVGILEDARKLLQDHGIDCESRVRELNEMAVKKFNNFDLTKVGLKRLAEIVLGQKMVKSKKVTMSDWARRDLSKDQVLYAASDAWVSFALFEELQTAEVVS